MGLRLFMLLLSMAFVTVASAQEQPGQGMATDTAIPALMFFTMGVALLIAVGAFIWFLRKRSNRDATRRAFDLDDRGPRR